MIYGFLGPLDGASQAESSTMPIGNTSEPAQLIQVRLRGYEECWPSREHLESVANLQLDIAVRSFVSDAFDFSKYDSRQRDTWPEVLKDYLAVNER
jgi:hypothetical protein